MRLALIISMSTILIGCDNDLPETDIRQTDWEFISSYGNPIISTGWLINKKTGHIEHCKIVDGDDLGTCTELITVEDRRLINARIKAEEIVRGDSG